VAEVSGRIVASAGNPERVIFFRSSAKPFQAIPLIESGAADAFGFSTAELALACSSHDATPMHQRGVARMLAKIGLDEDALRCGISPPADEEEAARITLGLKARSQIQCECSGEHAGMLAACRHLGYSLDDYIVPDHPLQQRIRAIVARVTRMPEADLVEGTDGCRIPTFGAPLRAFAVAYATFAAPDRTGDGAMNDLIAPMNRFRTAMLRHPVLIGGEQTLDTDIMRLSQAASWQSLAPRGCFAWRSRSGDWGSRSPAKTVRPVG
jgi:L-asparaginase II